MGPRGYTGKPGLAGKNGSRGDRGVAGPAGPRVSKTAANLEQTLKNGNYRYRLML